MPSPPRFQLDAPAKINLTLEVLGRRKDGYHEIASLLQTISLHDTLSFAPQDGGEVVVDCDAPALAGNPQANLVWRAARVLQQASGVTQGAHITLQKRIPLAAGLGGGSSDAATALRGLNQLWDLRLPDRELENLASLLGSDVPFFVRGGTALVEGRGEKVTPLRPLAGGWFVLVTPPLLLPDKTSLVYSLLRPYEYSKGAITRRLVDTLAAGQRPPHTMLYNGLEDAAFRAFDTLPTTTLHDVMQQIVAAGGEFARLTGAGPSLYCYCAEEAAAQALVAALAPSGLPAHLVTADAPI
ncbi:MAG TPA: 4-(cytidine 5'-diphospho)-2-C-methyl-D-erythritol kinase [Chloroflexia bacterium]|nr:4-(cytidine 5'-diphospho)-2-C-methyl-D-erythritol kinase [Chloroflexia bacterium]